MKKAYVIIQLLNRKICNSRVTICDKMTTKMSPPRFQNVVRLKFV